MSWLFRPSYQASRTVNKHRLVFVKNLELLGKNRYNAEYGVGGGVEKLSPAYYRFSPRATVRSLFLRIPVIVNDKELNMYAHVQNKQLYLVCMIIR